MSSIKGGLTKTTTRLMRAKTSALLSELLGRSSSRERSKHAGTSSGPSYASFAYDSPSSPVPSDEEQRAPTPPPDTGHVHPADMTGRPHDVEKTDPMDKNDEQHIAMVRGQDSTLPLASMVTPDASERAVFGAQEKQRTEEAQSGDIANWASETNTLISNIKGDVSQRGLNPHDPSTRIEQQGQQAQVGEELASMSSNGGNSRPHEAFDSHILPHVNQQAGEVLPQMVSSPSALSAVSPNQPFAPLSTPSLPKPHTSSPSSTPTMVKLRPTSPQRHRSPTRNSSAASSVTPLPRVIGGLHTQYPSNTPIPEPSLVPGGQEDGLIRPPIGAIPRHDPTAEEGSARGISNRSPFQEESKTIDVKGKDFARRCWKGDEEFLAKEEIAGWLGEQSSVNKIALQHYFQFFNFTGLQLDEAFRRLCDKLYLKAEAQQIDRILEEFGRRYWECNPTSIFGSPGVVYIVSYSLSMLNTDLHTTDSTKRMSRDDFVRNTMDAIQTRPGLVSEGSGHSPSTAIDEDRKHKMESTLKNIYNATKSQQIVLDSTQVSVPPSPPSDEDLHETGVRTPTPALGFVSKLTDMANGAGEDDEQDMSSDLDLLNPPWAKEGLLWHSHGLQLPEKSMKMTTWKDVFAVVQEGELSWFKFGGHGMGGSGTMGNGNWLNNAQAVRSVRLAHSVAQALPEPGYDDQRPRCVALTLANGECEYFQAGTEELVDEWVSTCNYWAARKSKEPLPGGDSNMEYGWNRILDPLPPSHSAPEDGKEMPSTDSDRRGRSKPSYSATLLARVGVSWSPQNDHIVIHDWKPPMPSPAESERSENNQLEALRKHVSSLETEFQKHNELRKRVMELRKSHPNDAAKADTNWGKRSQHLQAEIVKYRIYIDSLQSTIEARKQRTTESKTPTQSLTSGES